MCLHDLDGQLVGQDGNSGSEDGNKNLFVNGHVQLSVGVNAMPPLH